MKIAYYKLILTLGLLIAFESNAQEPDPNFAIQQGKLHNGFKNSLAAVNDVSGALSVQVVLGTVQSGGLTIPIGLSYNGQGVGAAAPNSEVGYGWTLSYGGMINRQVNSIPDETNATHADSQNGGYPRGYWNHSQNTFTTNFQRRMAGLNHRDNEPDLFNYSTLTGSGSFLIKRDESPCTGNVLGEVVQMPMTSNSIKLNHTTHDLSASDANNFGLGCFDFTLELGDFEIVDENGFKFNYEKGPDAVLLSGESRCVNHQSRPNCTMEYTDHWRPSAIYDVQGQEIVSYEYDLPFIQTIDQVSQSSFFTYNGQWSGENSITTSTSELTLNQELIDRIVFRGGEVHFEYTNTGPTGRTLWRVIFKDENSNDIREVRLIYDHTTYDRSFLNRIEEYDLHSLPITASSQPSNYQEFQYVPKSSHQSDTKNIDHWGFRNNADQTTLIPDNNSMHYFTSSSSGSDRTPKLAKTREGMLQRIRYNSGKEEFFNYELNDYSKTSGSDNFLNIIEFPDGDQRRMKPNAGGLRLESREIRNNNGDRIKENYNYDLVDDPLLRSSGIRLEPLNYRSLVSEWYEDSSSPYIISSGSYVSRRRHTLQGPVAYTTVRKTYEYWNGSSWTSQGADIGEIRSFYTFNHDVYTYPSGSIYPGAWPYLSEIYPDWENGLLYRTEYWGEYENSNGYDRKISETVYEYDYLKDAADDDFVFNSIEGQKFGKYTYFHPGEYTNYHEMGFAGANHTMESKFYFLKQEIRRQFYGYTFLGSEPEVNESTFRYLIEDPITLKPSLITTELHDGTELRERFKYVNDFSSSSDIVQSTALNIRELKRAGLITWPIEHARFIVEGSTEKLLQSKINFYRKIDNSQEVPAFSQYRITELDEPLVGYQMSTSLASEDDEFDYQSEYFSNPLSRVSEQDDNFRPIETIDQYDVFNSSLMNPETGRDHASIFNGRVGNSRYTSFESDNFHGGWSPDAPGIIDLTDTQNLPSGCPSYAPSGNNVYHLEGNTFNSLGNGALPEGKYILSFYSSGYFYPLEANTQVNVLSHSSNDVGEWTYNEYLFEWPQAGTWHISMGGNGFIDELRLYEKNAIMATKGYYPDGKLMYEADATSAVSSFSYDEKGRLSWIEGFGNEVIELKTYEEKNLLDELSFNKQTTYRAKEESMGRDGFANLGLSDSHKVSKSTSFYDGWGRHLQTQSLNVFQGYDMVSFRVYDNLGRELTKHLPYSTSLTDTETFIVDPESEQLAYYADRDDPNESTIVPYSQQLRENNPLQKPSKVSGIGEEFELGSGHETQYTYEYNTWQDGVLEWSFSHGGSWANSDDSGSPGKYYSPGSLRKTIVTDPNGRRSVSFSDAKGNKVAVGTYANFFENPSGTDVTGSIDVGNSSERLVLKYYVYDDWGRVRFIIPQKAIDQMAAMSTPHYYVRDWGFDHPNGHDEFVTCYRYDEKGRLRMEKRPSEDGNRHFYYDYKDRLILSHDPSQADFVYTFFKYDSQDRTVLTGEVSLTQSGMQDHIDQNSSIYNTERVDMGSSSSIYGYTNDAFPTIAEDDVMQVFYFDNYDFGPSTEYQFQAFEDISENTLLTRGLATGSQTRILPADGSIGQMLMTISYYDEKRRLIQSITENHKGGFDRLSNLYNERGQIEKTIQIHKYQESSTPVEVVTEFIYYSVSGKLRTIKHKVDDDTPVYISNRGYDDFGKLKELNLHKRGSANYMQSIDYRYNEKGQLTHINNASLVIDAFNEEDDDVFGQELMYHQMSPEAELQIQTVNYPEPSFNADYNGNISGMIWNVKTPDEDGAETNRHLYTYQYDDLGQLIQADYGMDHPSDPGQFNRNYGRYSANYNYDLGGNITRLQRRNQDKYSYLPNDGSGSNDPVASTAFMDDLTYTYRNGGFLLDRVDEGSNGMSDFSMLYSHFTDGAQQNEEYSYDEAGRNTIDLNKGIITGYNQINKPQEINLGDKNGIAVKYTYDAAGNKLAKKTGYAVCQPFCVETDYIGNFVYEDGELKMIYHPEGVARLTPEDSENETTYVYDYFVKDYLGNVRVVLTGENATEEVKFLATMEEVHRLIETENFDNLDETAAALPSGYPVGGSVQLNERIAYIIAEGEMTIGPSLVTPVRKGEIVNASVEYFYEEDAPGATYDNLGFFVDEILVSLASSAAGVVPIGEAALNNIASGNTPLGGQLYQLLSNSIDTTDMSRPHGYLVYVTYDNNQQIVPASSGAVQVTDPNQLRTILTNDIVAKKEGFTHIYVSNGSAAKGINFDNFLVTLTKAKTRQFNHYYPYGLPIAGIDGNHNDYLNKYTGKEHQTGEFMQFAEMNRGVEMFDFDARFFEPQLARWVVPDPAMQFSNPYLGIGNNPVMYVDPDGKFVFTSAMIIGAMIGSFVGAASAGYSGASNGQVMAGFGIGALAGAASGGVADKVSAGAGFIGGAIKGGASGFTGGFINSAGNAYVQNANLGDGLIAGLKGGGIGALSGAAIGGISSGIQAVKNGGNFWNGDGATNDFQQFLEQMEMEGEGLTASNSSNSISTSDPNLPADFSAPDPVKEVIRKYRSIYVNNQLGEPLGDHFDLSTIKAADGWTNDFNSMWTQEFTKGGSTITISVADQKSAHLRMSLFKNQQSALGRSFGIAGKNDGYLILLDFVNRGQFNSVKSYVFTPFVSYQNLPNYNIKD